MLGDGSDKTLMVPARLELAFQRREETQTSACAHKRKEMMMSARQSRQRTVTLEQVPREGLSDKVTAMLVSTDKGSSHKDREEEPCRQMEQRVQRLEDRNKLGQYENRKKYTLSERRSSG